MTEAELSAIEKTWGKVHSCDCSVCPFDSRDAAVLIAEVRRLSVIEAASRAYAEAASRAAVAMQAGGDASTAIKASGVVDAEMAFLAALAP